MGAGRAAAIICAKFPPRRSGSWFPDMLAVDHAAKCTSEMFRALVKSTGLCPIVGPAYHNHTDAKVERANGVIGDTLCAYANGRERERERAYL